METRTYSSNFLVLFLVFTTAFCNLVYELALAQMASSFLGGTLYRYAIYLGLFMSAMGFGSIFYKKIFAASDALRFVFVELALILASLLMPFILMFFYKNISSTSFEYIIYFFTLYLGFFSGIELPLLVDLFKIEETESFLFTDYFGMFLGSLSFSLLFFPNFGLFFSLWMGTALNLAVLCFYVYKMRLLNTLSTFALACLCIISFVLLIKNNYFFVLLQNAYLRG